MRTLLKIGAGMMLLAIILVGVSAAMLRAHAEGGGAANISGSHAMKTETRTIDGAVTVINANGPVDLVLRQGATPAMLVIAEERLLPRIKTRQQGNALEIDFQDTLFHSNHPMRIELTLPKLEQLSLHGSGDARVSGFSGDKVVLTLRGSGNMRFDGVYQHVTASTMGSGDLEMTTGSGADADLSILGSGAITASGQNKATTMRIMGSGDLNTENLHTDELKLDVMGSGDSSVYATKSVEINLHGSGDVSVRGNPVQRNVNRMGSGDISWD
ncbi:MAG TPA: head GIN domain-containing protein [Burkholderiaceae bacterium]